MRTMINTKGYLTFMTLNPMPRWSHIPYRGGEQNGPRNLTSIGDIFTHEFDKKFDAVVCNGAFNIIYKIEELLEGLCIMDGLSEKMTLLTASYIKGPEIDELKRNGYQVIDVKQVYGHGDDYCIFKFK